MTTSAPSSSTRPATWRADLAIDEKGEVKPSYGNLCVMLRALYSERLSYDAMREAVCIDGSTITDAQLGRIREDLERKHGVAFSADNVARGVGQVAEERRVHPVQKYLEALEWDMQPRLGRVAEEILRTKPTPLVVSMLTRWFVSAVARAFEPGAKVDTCLILQGRQAAKKSTFFATLGGPFFADTAIDISVRQAYIQLASAWIYEWSELETITTKKAISEVKAFITSRSDTFVPPYGRAAITHLRTTIIVGTTNEQNFLNDPTGSRRWWVVKVGDHIDIEKLREWRDQLWAEAVAHYLDGFEWWLEQEQEDAREIAAKRFVREDAWDQPIQRFIGEWRAKPRDPRLNIGDALTSYVVLVQGLKIEAKGQDPGALNRVGAIMRRLGYQSVRMRCGEAAQRLRVWVPEAEAGADDDEEDDAMPRAPP